MGVLVSIGIEMSDLRFLTPVHASMVGVAHNPHSSSGALHIELWRHPVDFHENVLHHFFPSTDGVKGFPSDMERQSQNES